MTVVDRFKTRISKDESRDTGMAMVLLALIVFIYTRRNGALVSAIVLHVLNMTAPQIFRLPAIVWLGLSQVLGKVMSTVVLTTTFIVIVSAVGLIRRLLGKDSLQLRRFRTGSESVMVKRNHTFVGADIEHPY